MTRSAMKATLGALALAVITEASAAAQTLEVHKTPWCGCCEAWAIRMEEAGFEVAIHETEDLEAVKAAHGVPGDLMSCHTATVDGYVIEGHVPAEDIRRLLAERPEAAGLAVPGMPHGSPGMETGRIDPYQTILFGDGPRSVWAEHQQD